MSKLETSLGFGFALLLTPKKIIQKNMSLKKRKIKSQEKKTKIMKNREK